MVFMIVQLLRAAESFPPHTTQGSGIVWEVLNIYDRLIGPSVKFGEQMGKFLLTTWNPFRASKTFLWKIDENPTLISILRLSTS